MEKDVQSLVNGIQPLGTAGPIRSSDEPLEDDEATDKLVNVIREADTDRKSFRAYLEAPEWQLVPFTEGDGISCFYLLPEHADQVHRFTKARGTIVGKTADQIARRHRDSNKITRLGWDKDIADIGPIKIVSSNDALGISLDMQWAVVQPYGPAFKREHVFYQFSRASLSDRENVTDHSWIIITRSTLQHDRPVPQKASDRLVSFQVMLLEPLTPADSSESILPVPRTSITLMGWSDPQDLDTALAKRIAFLQTVKFP